MPLRETHPSRVSWPSEASQRLCLSHHHLCPAPASGIVLASSLQTPIDSLFCQKAASSRQAALLSAAFSADLTIRVRVFPSCMQVHPPPCTGGAWTAGSPIPPFCMGLLQPTILRSWRAGLVGHTRLITAALTEKRQVFRAPGASSALAQSAGRQHLSSSLKEQQRRQSRRFELGQRPQGPPRGQAQWPSSCLDHRRGWGGAGPGTSLA